MKQSVCELTSLIEFEGLVYADLCFLNLSTESQYKTQNFRWLIVCCGKTWRWDQLLAAGVWKGCCQPLVRSGVSDHCKWTNHWTCFIQHLTHPHMHTLMKGERERHLSAMQRIWPRVMIRCKWLSCSEYCIGQAPKVMGLYPAYTAMMCDWRGFLGRVVSVFESREWAVSCHWTRVFLLPQVVMTKGSWVTGTRSGWRHPSWSRL